VGNGLEKTCVMCCLNGWGRGDIVLRRNFRLRGVGIGVVVLVGPPVGWCVELFFTNVSSFCENVKENVLKKKERF
jgi:hypothetical protein